MNEMLTFPLLVVLLLSTAILSSIVTTMLPYMPKYWHAIKTRIKRVFTYKRKQNVYCDDLQDQINTLAEKLATREKHLKGNVRRYVRGYLQEIKDGLHDK